MIGQQIGQYKVIRKLGQGGMGVVYEAMHVRLDLRAAIKILLLDSAADAQAASRFLTEARAASAVHHTSLVRTFDFGSLADGSVYMMMEYLDGQTLRDRLVGGRLALVQALRLGSQMAAALAAVHEARIVHCDLKPSNVMLIADREAEGGERAKLLDFGIAMLGGDALPSSPRTRLAGTPLYMSPEQCAGVASLDDRSDVYSLGLVLFEMLTAEHPYDVAGKDRRALLELHVRAKPRALRPFLPTAPADLFFLISQMLAKEAVTRPPMIQVRERLKELVAAALGPPPAPPATEDTMTGAGEAQPPDRQREKPATDLQVVRQVLGAVLVVNPDFDAFCMDHYPQIYRRFSPAMDRAAREALLLALANLDELVAKLRRIEPRVLGTLPAQRQPAALAAGQRTVQPPRAPFDRNWYVSRREEEEQARDALDYHKPIVLFGPELCGKTWLLSSLLEHAREQEYRIASINLNLIDKPARATLELFLHKFALRLCKELQLDQSEVERAFASPRSGPIEALHDVMCRTVLPAIDGPLLLAIDNVDLIAEKPYQDEYFGLLRAWADSGGPLARLHLALCISTAPALLVRDVHRSPFNLGDVIELPDLDRDQLLALATLHGVSCTNEELGLLQAQVGGHPYLARLVLYECHRRRKSLAALLAQVDSDPRGGVVAGYLDHLRSRLQLQPELLAALRSVAHSPAASIEPALGRRLEQAGLVILGDPVQRPGALAYRVRCRLYQRLVQ